MSLLLNLVAVDEQSASVTGPAAPNADGVRHRLTSLRTLVLAVSCNILFLVSIEIETLAQDSVSGFSLQTLL